MGGVSFTGKHPECCLFLREKQLSVLVFCATEAAWDEASGGGGHVDVEGTWRWRRGPDPLV